MEFLSILLTAGKIIGGAKSVKTVVDFAVEDGEEKKRQKRRERQLKREENLIRKISQRNMIETLIAYIIGWFAAVSALALGVLGIFIIVIFYLNHINRLHKISDRTKVKREGILTGISILLVVIILI